MGSKYYVTALLLVTFLITSCGISDDNDSPEWVGVWEWQFEERGPLQVYLDISKNQAIEYQYNTDYPVPACDIYPIDGNQMTTNESVVKLEVSQNTLTTTTIESTLEQLIGLTTTYKKIDALPSYIDECDEN